MAEVLFTVAFAVVALVSAAVTLFTVRLNMKSRKVVYPAPATKRESVRDVLRDAYRQKSEARRVLAKQWDDQFVQLWIEHGPKYRMGSDTIRDVQMLREMLEKNEYEMRMHRELHNPYRRAS